MFKKQVNDKDYIPNHISMNQRLVRLLSIVCLLVYGGHGIYKGELYLAYGRGEITLLGDAIYVAYASFIVGSLYLILRIIDHYDKRNNEHHYRRLETILKGVAMLVFLAALVVNLTHTYET